MGMKKETEYCDEYCEEHGGHCSGCCEEPSCEISGICILHCDGEHDGPCKVMEWVGHLTLEQHQEIVEKNIAWWAARAEQKKLDKAGFEGLDEMFGTHVAIGCKLDPSDKSPDAERRYVEVEE